METIYLNSTLKVKLRHKYSIDWTQKEICTHNIHTIRKIANYLFRKTTLKKKQQRRGEQLFERKIPEHLKEKHVHCKDTVYTYHVDKQKNNNMLN